MVWSFLYKHSCCQIVVCLSKRHTPADGAIESLQLLQPQTQRSFRGLSCNLNAFKQCKTQEILLRLIFLFRTGSLNNQKNIAGMINLFYSLCFSFTAAEMHVDRDIIIHEVFGNILQIHIQTFHKTKHRAKYKLYHLSVPESFNFYSAVDSNSFNRTVMAGNQEGIMKYTVQVEAPCDFILDIFFFF